MQNPQQVYNDNVGQTHGVAVQAVYDAGAADALNSSPTLVVPAYPDLSENLSAALAEVEAGGLQITALHDQITALEAEIAVLR
jgi:hypothetical protein